MWLGWGDPDMTLEALNGCRFTNDGEFQIKLTNKTGAASVRGELVKADPATDFSFILTAADDDECLGVVAEAGVADASDAWVTISGRAQVLLKDTTAATRGNWVATSDAAGRADATVAAPPGVPAHFQEIGHAIENVGAGVDQLAWIVMHFN